MIELRRVQLEALCELRKRVLTPGHPGRPVIWPYDGAALHFGAYDEERLVGCVSVTAQPMPGRAAIHPYHLHSMAVEPDIQRRGVGREMLGQITEVLLTEGCDLIWATARLSAVGFYEGCGFDSGETFEIQPTGAPMRYVWVQL